MVDREGLREIGVTKVELSRSNCNFGECNIGSFLADAYAHAMIEEAEVGEWSYAPIVLFAVGGIRTSLSRGALTYSDLVATIPFENTLDTMDLTGTHLLMALEFAATKSWDEDRFNGATIVQVSGRLLVDVCNLKIYLTFSYLRNETGSQRNEPRWQSSDFSRCSVPQMHGSNVFAT